MRVFFRRTIHFLVTLPIALVAIALGYMWRPACHAFNAAGDLWDEHADDFRAYLDLRSRKEK